MSSPFPLEQLFGGRPLIAVDTETTGLWAPVNKIVEIGAVKFQLGVEAAKTYQSLVNPLRIIPENATGVHGITNEMVAGAPTIGLVLGEFLEFIGDGILVAHNAPFDISFIGCELDRAGSPIPNNPVLDTVDIFHHIYPGFPSYSLLNLITAFGIAQNQEHRALSDAFHVRSLCELMAQRLAEMANPYTVMGQFAVHSLQRWLPREIELPAQYSDISVAIKNQQALEIMYWKDGSGPQPRLIRPRHVLSRKTLYYVVAYCETARAERTFRLDRIVSFQLSDK